MQTYKKPSSGGISQEVDVNPVNITVYINTLGITGTPASVIASARKVGNIAHIEIPLGGLSRVAQGNGSYRYYGEITLPWAPANSQPSAHVVPNPFLDGHHAIAWIDSTSDVLLFDYQVFGKAVNAGSLTLRISATYITE